MSGITTFAKGGWAPVFDLGPDTSGTGESHMPDRTCNPNSVPGGRSWLHWWNPSCITPVPAAQYGRLGTSNLAAFTVPGINTWDVSIQKSFKTKFLIESGEIQFRCDMFNAWNHVQWASPTQYIYSGEDPIYYGRIGATRPARQMQASLRYNF